MDHFIQKACRVVLAAAFVLSSPLHLAVDHCAALEHYEFARIADACLDGERSGCHSHAAHGEAKCHRDGATPHQDHSHDQHHGIDEHRHDTAVRALASSWVAVAILPAPLQFERPAFAMLTDTMTLGPRDWDPGPSTPQRGPPSIPVIS